MTPLNIEPEPSLSNVSITESIISMSSDEISELVSDQLMSQEAKEILYLDKGNFYLNSLRSFAENELHHTVPHPLVHIYTSLYARGGTHYNLKTKDIHIDLNTSVQGFPVMLGHEFAHLLQDEKGLLNDFEMRDGDYRYATEAQADYFAGGYLRHLKDTGNINQQQYRDSLDLVYSIGDQTPPVILLSKENIDRFSQQYHGTPDERLYYFLQGFTNFDAQFYGDIKQFVRSKYYELPSIAGKIMSNIKS